MRRLICHFADDELDSEFAGLEVLDPDNTYLRPVLFYAQNATDLSIEGIHMKDSPCWTNFVVTCELSLFRLIWRMTGWAKAG